MGGGEGTPARFVWNRFTPGELGLEVTTLLALAAVGSFTFVLLGTELDEQARLPLDRAAFSVADGFYAEPIKDVVVWASALGAPAAVGPVVLATAAWAGMRGRFADGACLAAALVVTWLAVDVAKAAFDRPRPPGSHVFTDGSAYPSGHAANAVAWVGCAAVLARGGSGLAARFAAVTAAVVVTALVALSRVYLRASHLSDVAGGVGLATAIFGLLGVAALVVGRLRHNDASRP